MKNKRQIKSIIFAIIFVLVLNFNISFATTITYDNWSKLSEEEKKNYIEPTPISVDIEDSIKNSKLNNLLSVQGNYESKYNLADDIDITVKDQKTTKQCWAFSLNSAIETYLSKLTKKTSDIYSARYLDYATSKTFLDGINSMGYNREVNTGGNPLIGLSFYTSGKGPVLESQMPFSDNVEKINLSQIQNKTVNKKIAGYTQIANIYKEYESDGTVKYYNGKNTTSRVEYTTEQVNAIRQVIKGQIKSNGALTAYTYAGQTDSIDYFNIEKIRNKDTTNYSYYCDKTTAIADHAITIVGWDDNFSAENFNNDHKPKNNGAYIVLNSYGTNICNDGYMYVSYDDILIETSLFGITEVEDIEYDNIYQHDDYGCSIGMPMKAESKEVSTLYAANVFDRKDITKNEYINEVSVYVTNTSNVSIYINEENDDKTKIKLVAEAGILESGYHTVKLSTPIKLTGSKFVVAAKYGSDFIRLPLEFNYLSNGSTSNYWDVATSKEGQSFVSTNTEKWQDLTTILKDSNVCVKAFTKYIEEPNVPVESISLNKTTAELTVGESTNLSVIFNPTNATNQKVVWKSSDDTIATVSQTGVIKSLKEGQVTISATSEDGNKVASCKISVQAKKTNVDDKYYQNIIISTNNINVDNNVVPTPINNNLNDTTVAKTSIPQTGNSITAIVFISIIIIAGIIIYVRYRSLNDIK